MGGYGYSWIVTQVSDRVRKLQGYRYRGTGTVGSSPRSPIESGSSRATGTGVRVQLDRHPGLRSSQEAPGLQVQGYGYSWIVTQVSDRVRKLQGYRYRGTGTVGSSP